MWPPIVVCGRVRVFIVVHYNVGFGRILDAMTGSLLGQLGGSGGLWLNLSTLRQASTY